MLRINSTVESSRVVLEVAGKLESAHVAELSAHCERLDEPPVLDLSELQSADAGAVCWLRGFLERGGTVIAASPYVRFLLEKEQARLGRDQQENR